MWMRAERIRDATVWFLRFVQNNMHLSNLAQQDVREPARFPIPSAQSSSLDHEGDIFAGRRSYRPSRVLPEHAPRVGCVDSYSNVDDNLGKICLHGSTPSQHP